MYQQTQKRWEAVIQIRYKSRSKEELVPLRKQLRQLDTLMNTRKALIAETDKKEREMEAKLQRISEVRKAQREAERNAREEMLEDERNEKARNVEQLQLLRKQLMR